MTMRVMWLAVAAVMLSVSGAAAFDGHRAGFVVGGGAGFAPYAAWKLEANDKPHDEKPGGTIDLLIGYGWNRNNLLTFDIELTQFNSAIYGRDARIVQGFVGPSWYRYFGPYGRAFFITLGFGLETYSYCYDTPDECYGLNNGISRRFGAGYEFVRHFQAGLYASRGYTYSSQGYSMRSTTVSVLVSGVAY